MSRWTQWLFEQAGAIAFILALLGIWQLLSVYELI